MIRRLREFYRFVKSIVTFGASDTRADYEKRIAGE